MYRIVDKIAASKMDVVRIRANNCQSDVIAPPWQYPNVLTK